MFALNVDIFEVLKSIKTDKEFLEAIGEPEIKDDLSLGAAQFCIDRIGSSLEGSWREFSTLMLRSVINFIIDHYLNEGQKLSLQEGLRAFYKSTIWLYKAREFLFENEVLKERAPVIIDAMEAHLSGKYNISVPLLLIQLRGLFGSICSAPRAMKMDSADFPSGSSHFKVTGLCIKIPVNFRGKHVDDLCAEILKGINLFTGSKRRVILSGQDCTYGTIENSTELMMFLHIVFLALGMKI